MGLRQRSAEMAGFLGPQLQIPSAGVTPAAWALTQNDCSVIPWWNKELGEPGVLCRATGSSHGFIEESPKVIHRPGVQSKDFNSRDLGELFVTTAWQVLPWLMHTLFTTSLRKQHFTKEVTHLLWENYYTSLKALDEAELSGERCQAHEP